jgi:hypothetical protein
VYNIDSNYSKFVNYPFNTHNIISITAYDRNTAIITCQEGVFNYSFSSESYTTVKTSCDARLYGAAQYNRQNSRLYCSKIEQERINGSTIRSREKVVSMNLDGSDEQELALPE